jgi:site-specific DNA-adenine methylase|tara:strand:+ start:48 stop:896 length:849 start_codon:yes stop_codon:yes gene_type:complete
MKALKTPLRYPGGKSRACTKMDVYIPDLRDYKEYREPFLGGGSVAIHITKKYPHLDIWVNDLYEPLYNFWRVLQDDGYELYKRLQELKSRYPDPGSAKGLFLEAKELVNDYSISPLHRACSFYVINKCSFSGLTESSSFSKQASDNNFSMRGIEKLQGYTQIIKDWKITNLSYEQLLTDDKKCFTYLDPPYDIKDNLYGKKGSMHNGFNHDDFAADCDRFIGHQLISYNSSQLVKDRFKDYQTGEFDLTYTMRSVGEYMREQKERKELLLFNYGTEGLAELN